jgi:hypothetical protein
MENKTDSKFIRVVLNVEGGYRTIQIEATDYWGHDIDVYSLIEQMFPSYLKLELYDDERQYGIQLKNGCHAVAIFRSN